MSLRQFFGSCKNWCAAHESELWLGGSILLDGVTIFTTIMSTNKAKENKAKHDEDMGTINTAHENGKCENGVEYTEDDYDKDRVCETIRYVGKQALTYLPPVASAVGSAFCAYKCYDHQNKVISGYAGALSAATAFISSYMARTKEVVGEEKEMEIRTGLKKEEVEVKEKDPETGKTVKRKVSEWRLDPTVEASPLLSPYAIKLTRQNNASFASCGSDDIHMSAYFSIVRNNIQRLFEMRADATQKMYLDEVLEELHITPTSRPDIDWDMARLVGWMYCKEYKDMRHPENGKIPYDGDVEISIGYPVDEDNDDKLCACQLVRDANGDVYLDFNVFGPILYLQPVPYTKDEYSELVKNLSVYSQK